MASLALLRLYAGLLHINFVCFISRNIRYCLNNMNRSLLWAVQKMFGRSCLYKKGVVRIYRYWKTCETVSLVSGSHTSKTSYKSMGNSNTELVIIIWTSILKQTERVASTVRRRLNSNNSNYRPTLIWYRIVYFMDSRILYSIHLYNDGRLKLKVFKTVSNY